MTAPYLRTAGAILAMLLLGSGSAGAATIIGGVEDLPFGPFSARTGDRDFNDMIFRLEGTINITAPGSLFNLLTPGIVTGQGNTYWDSPSVDGPKGNIGYCLLGSNVCPLPPLPTGIQYLATSGGGAPEDILFTATGAITATLLGENAGLAGLNSLGWYDPDRPDQRHEIFSGPMKAGTVVTFTPSSRFYLYFLNGIGQAYSSQSTMDLNEFAGTQHFAIFRADGTTPPPPVPEPGTVLLIGAGLALCGTVTRASGPRKRIKT